MNAPVSWRDFAIEESPTDEASKNTDVEFNQEEGQNEEGEIEFLAQEPDVGLPAKRPKKDSRMKATSLNFLLK